VIPDQVLTTDQGAFLSYVKVPNGLVVMVEDREVEKNVADFDSGDIESALRGEDLSGSSLSGIPLAGAGDPSDNAALEALGLYPHAPLP